MADYQQGYPRDTGKLRWDMGGSWFTDEEIRGIREGVDGIKRSLPARFYHDEAIYRHEVEHVLKKNWLCVGRWDRAQHPGDYFTCNMFGESIVIVRDHDHALHALVNVCQHRWSQVVPDGSGNTQLLTCPYHRWSYNLDGTLRGVSVQPLPGLDTKACRMPALRTEEWQGFIFINFDADARPLAPQLAAVNPLLERHNAAGYRHHHAVDYESTWNWKYSFETGYEGYHHAGLHNERFNHIEPASGARPLDLGETCGAYAVPFADNIPKEETRPFGLAPGMKEEDPKEIDTFIAVYPGLILFCNSYQLTYILTEHRGVAVNTCSTRQSFAPWALDAPNAQEMLTFFTELTTDIQNEDTYGCQMLQKGIRSRTNTGGYIHPLEIQLNHYHNWYMNQFLQTNPK